MVGAILILPTYPFVIIIDTLFRCNDLLFLSPEMKRKEQELNKNDCCSGRESSFFAFYRKIMHRPLFRIIDHHFMEFVFLVIIALATIDPYDRPVEKDLYIYDYTLGIISDYFI